MRRQYSEEEPPDLFLGEFLEPLDVIVQALPSNELHYYVEVVVVFIELSEATDVRMDEILEGSHLPLPSLSVWFGPSWLYLP